MKTVNFVVQKGNNNLDFVRIILAISVIYGHGYFMVDNHGGKELLNQLFPFTYSGSLAVKIFFFISGMLVTNSLLKGSTATSFLVSRFFRIAPAFFVTIIVTAFVVGPILTSYSLGKYFADPILFEYIKSNPLTGVSYKLPGLFEDNHMKYIVNGSLWTIPYEVRAYLGLLAIFMVIGCKQEKLSTAICLIVIMIPIMDLNKYTFINIQSNDSKLVISCFALGALYAINQKRIPVNIHIPAGLFLLHYFINDAVLSQTLFFFSACSFSLWIASLDAIRKINPKHDISYGVYLWGFLVQQVVSSHIHSYGVAANQFASVIITIVLGYLSYILIEKPGINAGSKLKYILKQRNSLAITA